MNTKYLCHTFVIKYASSPALIGHAEKAVDSNCGRRP